jgi:hypothetical protein
MFRPLYYANIRLYLIALTEFIFTENGDYTNNTIGLQKTKQAPTTPPYRHSQDPPEFLLLIPHLHIETSIV